eukprot:scaffold156478_cov28-Tisochrysis_lutea.AAC.8
MGVLPTDDSAKYEWDSAKGTGAPISAKLMAALDPEKKFLSQVIALSSATQHHEIAWHRVLWPSL